MKRTRLFFSPKTFFPAAPFALLTVPLCLAGTARAQFTMVNANVVGQERLNKSGDSGHVPYDATASSAVTAVTGGATGQAVVTANNASGVAGNSHGCAGATKEAGLPGTAGEGSGSGTASPDYIVTSSLLSQGAPALVTIRIYGYAEGGAKLGLSDDNQGLDFLRARGGVFGFGGSFGVSGTYEKARRFQVNDATATGLFSGQGFQTITLNSFVGAHIGFDANLNLTASADSAPDTYNAADVRAGIQWALSSADCELLDSTTNQPAPPVTDAPPIPWRDLLPPYQLPTGLESAAPEPGTLALMGVGCWVFCAKRKKGVGVLQRRRRG